MILDAQLYLKRRKENLLTKYRLQRRVEKVIEVIKEYSNSASNELFILDIGAADGYMLAEIKKQLKVKNLVGVEPNEELIRASHDGIKLVKGHGENLPCEDNQYDVVIISATIEHTKDPLKVISETYRVLKPHGIAIVITVVPFLDIVAEKLRIFPKSLHRHFHRFNLKQLKMLFIKNKFKVLKLDKFALPTVELLGLEKVIEKILSFLGIKIFMTYELCVGEKV